MALDKAVEELLNANAGLLAEFLTELRERKEAEAHRKRDDVLTTIGQYRAVEHHLSEAERIDLSKLESDGTER